LYEPEFCINKLYMLVNTEYMYEGQCQLCTINVVNPVKCDGSSIATIDNN